MHTMALLRGKLRKAQNSEKKYWQELIRDVDEHKVFLLWIKLPHSRKFYRNEIRVVTLDYETDIDDIEKNDRFMEFHASTYEVFYVISPPSDFEFDKTEIQTIDPSTLKVIKMETSWVSKKGEPYYFKQSQNSISVRIRPNSPNQYLFVYSFKPSSTITTFPYIVLGLLILGSALVLLSNMEPFLTNCDGVSLCWLINHVDGKQSDFALAIFAASLIIPRLIRNVEVRNLLKFWYIAPMIITTIGLFL